MRIAFLSEGPIDEILIPPLVRCVLEEIDVNSRVDDVDFDPPIQPRTRGYGWVLNAVRTITERIDEFREIYDLFVLLVDRRSNQNTIEEITNLIRGHDEFIFAVAVPEVESWVLADTPSMLDWLRLPQTKIAEFPCLHSPENFEFEKEQNSKRLINDMLEDSKSEYDTWGKAAAEEFTDGRWAGLGIVDYYSSQMWTGKASLDLISNRCPQGFRPFRQVLSGKFTR